MFKDVKSVLVVLCFKRRRCRCSQGFQLSLDHATVTSIRAAAHFVHAACPQSHHVRSFTKELSDKLERFYTWMVITFNWIPPNKTWGWFHKNEGGNATSVTSTSSWSTGFIEPVSFLCYLSCCSGNASEVENLILLGLTIGMVQRKPSERNSTAHCVQTTVWPTIRQGQLQNKNNGHRQTSGTSGIWTGLYIEPVPIPGFEGDEMEILATRR